MTANVRFVYGVGRTWPVSVDHTPTATDDEIRLAALRQLRDNPPPRWLGAHTSPLIRVEREPAPRSADELRRRPVLTVVRGGAR